MTLKIPDTRGRVAERKTGFSLVEIVVVMGVMAIIMATVTMLLFNSYKARTRIEVNDVMEEQGNLVLRQIKDNILTAAGIGMSCPTGAGVGTSVAFISIRDGGVTTLKCIENGKIASDSAGGTFDLTTNEVVASDCSNFAHCTAAVDAPEKMVTINFSFRLSSGTSGLNGAARDFNSSLVVRN